MEDHPPNLDVDDALNRLGCGRFQILFYAMIAMLLCLHCTCAFSYAFTTRDTQYRCFVDGCDPVQNATYEAAWIKGVIPDVEGTLSKCTRKTNLGKDNSCDVTLFSNDSVESCDSWIYGDGESIVKEYNIPCQEWKRSLVGTVSSIGKVLGMFLSGIVSDNFGRKTVMVYGAVACAAFGIAHAFSPDYWTFVVFEFLKSFIASGVYTASLVLAIELMTPKRRVMGLCIINAMGGLSCIISSAGAWLFSNWRRLLIVIHGPNLMFISYLWVFPESVRWLVARGRYEEADEILKRAARMNRVILPQGRRFGLKRTLPENRSLVTCNPKVMKRQPFKAILRSKILTFRFAICAVNNFIIEFIFVGVYLNAIEVNNDGNPFLQSILVCLMEYPAIVIKLMLLNTIGRKMSLFWSLIGASCFFTLFVFLSIQKHQLVVPLYLLGKLCITVSSGTFYMYVGELFPTGWRNTVMGTTLTAGKMGHVLANQLPMMVKIHPMLPVALFGMLSIAAGFSMLMFPETLNVKLPDTIEEAEKISS